MPDQNSVDTKAEFSTNFEFQVPTEIKRLLILE